ncbi:MAG: hypothetical protein HKP30_08455 [Myxococcales bacterium]|nr:hypothetical protein [Myxococcales bacterium]
MSLRPVFCLALAAALLLPVSPAAAEDTRPSEVPYDTPGPVPALDPSYRMESHKVVLITDQALRPKRVFLEKGQLVAWVSYAPQPSIIVFEREVARDMICHSLVNFTIKEDELRSAPIHAGEFASFCQLKPGRYRYKVVRPDPGTSGAGSRARVEGEIVVLDPEAEGANQG